MVDYRWYAFDELSLQDLYQMLALRSEVFVVEQACAYQDLDGQDQIAVHLLAKDGDEIVAYLRVLANPDGSMSFGRVVTSPRRRGLALGKQLVQHAMDYLQTRHSSVDVKISAQYYLLDFYRRFGLKPQGDIYDEDGIPHIAMVLYR